MVPGTILYEAQHVSHEPLMKPGLDKLGNWLVRNMLPTFVADAYRRIGSVTEEMVALSPDYSTRWWQQQLSTYQGRPYPLLRLSPHTLHVDLVHRWAVPGRFLASFRESTELISLTTLETIGRLTPDDVIEAAALPCLMNYVYDVSVGHWYQQAGILIGKLSLTFWFVALPPFPARRGPELQLRHHLDLQWNAESLGLIASAKVHLDEAMQGGTKFDGVPLVSNEDE